MHSTFCKYIRRFIVNNHDRFQYIFPDFSFKELLNVRINVEHLIFIQQVITKIIIQT